MNSICACIGPAFGEEFCSCAMVNRGIERSVEYKEYMSADNVLMRDVETRRVLSAVLLTLAHGKLEYNETK